ncbi:MAG: AAA family ATPase [Anaerolineaceae bacterium]
MRIAVSGKGGAGKTTTSATLARLLARDGYRVTAIDGDPNPNLAVSLGLSEEARARLELVPRTIFEDRENADGERKQTLTRPLDDIVRDYAIAGPDGVSVMMMLGIDHAGAG